MKTFKYTLIAIIALTFLFNVEKIYSKVPTANQLLFNSAQGKDFWIAIPPNEDDRQPVPNVATIEIALEIYVTSSKNCTCTMQILGTGQIVTKKVEAMKITTFTSLKHDLEFSLEVRTSEQVVHDKCIWLHADQPISVYVLNHRQVTADGYLGIPITSCGTDYIHLAYYDFHEDNYGPPGECRGAGFIITAAEDNTVCHIKLKGVGGSVAKCLGGHKIGDSWTVTLNRADLYCVMGDGLSRGQFDLSGSEVTSNKPVGFISFHKRTLIPSFDLWNGRNMMTEMIPPIQAWGKKYCTVEFKRKDQGDFFRIIASQDNTTFTVKWYDCKTQQLLGQRSGLMKKAGDFFEYEEVFVQQGVTNTIKSIRGTSVWTADKPVLVMQYSYSQDWDVDGRFDPFMILVVPTEQFIPGTVFQTPEPSSGFLDNYFNIVAIGDTVDLSQPGLKSLVLDGKYIWQLDPGFVFNQIPTTNLYWSKLTVPAGAHQVAGNTKFGGYIYGFSSADGYGWPAATAVNKVDETDTLPPVLTVASNCGDYDFRATEFRNGKTTDNPRQIDQGILSVDLLDSSFNYVLIMIDSLVSYPPQYDVHFSVKVLDKTKPAYAIIEVTDRAGNYTLDTLYYYPASFSIIPSPLEFGNVRLNITKTITATITNTSDSAVTVTSITLLSGTVFKITNGGAPPEFVMQPKEIRNITIDYTPTTEGITPDQRDWDSLLVVTKCLNFSWPIDGRGVIPKIKVQDWDFGSVIVNKKACIDDQNQQGHGLTIQNVGTDTLVITNIQNMVAPFELSIPFTPSLPIIIPPDTSVYLLTVCFAPTVIGDTTINVLFTSNAEGVDSIAVLKGRGIQPGPIITSKDWGERRVKTLNDSVVVITNQGTSRVTITGVSLGTNSPDFSITGTVPAISPGNPVDLIPVDSSYGVREIQVNVRFNPQSEAILHNTVVPEFDPNDGITPGSVVGNLDGVGILPKIELIGYEFLPPILVGTTHPTQGFVTIKSTSTTADLWIEDIHWQNPAQTEFAFVATPPSKFKMLRGSTIKIPVTFSPNKVNTSMETVEVVNDAAEGPDPNPLVNNDTVVIGHAFDKGIQVDSLNFGIHMLCDQPVKQFHITNTATTTDAIIQNIVLIAGDVNAFQILTPTPQTITAGQIMGFDVKFTPFNKVPLVYSAIARVYSDVDSSQYVLLQGRADTMSITFSLRKYSVNDKLQPGMNVTVDVSAQLTQGAWQNAKITSFSLNVLFDKTWMLYSKQIDLGPELDGTWSVTATEQAVDQNMKKLVITGSGTTPISAAGIIAKPHFMLLLSSDYQFVPTIDNQTISVGARDVCVNRYGLPGYVVMNTCVKDLRSIMSSGIQYALHEINPNPANHGNIAIKYDVGLKGATTIEIINSTGETVSEVVNEVKDAGNYEADVPIDRLSSGLYFVKMHSEMFYDMKQLVIAK